MDVSVGRQMLQYRHGRLDTSGSSIELKEYWMMERIADADVAVVANFTEDDTAIKVCSPVFYPT
jgi:hypothetical protein